VFRKGASCKGVFRELCSVLRGAAGTVLGAVWSFIARGLRIMEFLGRGGVASHGSTRTQRDDCIARGTERAALRLYKMGCSMRIQPKSGVKPPHSKLTVAEVFGVGVGIAEVVVN